ncbi:MAG: ATP-dependent DNA ligase [Pseudomonadota bacterium]
MKRFTDLYGMLDQTTKTNTKVAALADYFGSAPDADKLWTVALFSGRRPRRAITTTKLREWAAERADIPLWLFEESYPIVGDLAETIALVLPEPARDHDDSLATWITRLRALDHVEEGARKSAVLDAWDQMDAQQRLVFNKLLTGGFRIGISRKLMTRALAQATGMDEAELAHRLMGDWTPDTTSWATLIEAPDASADLSRPYPFCLAYGLDDETPAPLGDPPDWRAEWKWDGIRGQLILRGSEHFIWSRGEDLMTDRFPELACAKDFLPDGIVIDGEIVAWDGAAPLPFNALQKRIGRKTVPKKLLKEAPVIMLAYDLLEHNATDLRDRPFDERRAALDTLLSGLPTEAPVRASPLIPFKTWSALGKTRNTARNERAEGLMLKRADSVYHAGRKKGDWWKWKLDPLTIDAVMIYAQQGHGRRANLFTDFTFAVRDGNELVPFTKAYSGLTDDEFRKITSWVRKNTLQRFGPVRQVRAEHVFEIAFEGIAESTRHKSGVSLRFPRMKRWRHDKPVDEANTIEDLREMLVQYG